MTDSRKPFAEPDVRVERRPDGSLLLRSGLPLGDQPVSVLHDFRAWAREGPGTCWPPSAGRPVAGAR